MSPMGPASGPVHSLGVLSLSPGRITVDDLDPQFLAGLGDHLGASVGADFMNCIQCGTCTASCPSAHAMDDPPRRLVRMASLGLWKEMLSGRSIWQCLTCASCQARCPRGIEITGGMLALRREAGRRVGLPEGMARLTSTVDEVRNITGDVNENRGLWCDDMNVRLPTVDEVVRSGARLDAVYFTGCVASLFPAVYSIPRAVSGILYAAGVKSAVMAGEEWCCGFPLIGAGAADTRLETLVRHNVEVVRKTGAGRLVVSCPSCYHTWKHIYDRVYGAGLGFEIIHSTRFFTELLEGGRLKPHPREIAVTYHDPCDLGRKSGIFDEPRAVLGAIPGLELREMRFHGMDSKCCGGGGNLEMNDPALSGGVAMSRLAQALNTGATVVVSSCQQCKRTLQGAARREKARVKVQDVAEVLLQAVSA
ncbi:MAG: (Fe-S)-binding protein, partial [Bacillota bacterium]